MNGLPVWHYPGWCLNDNAKLRSAPSTPSRLCHVCNAHLPHHLALMYPQSSTLSNCPTTFSPLPSPFPPLLRPPTLFFAVQRDAGLPRRTVASLAPLYIKEAESTAADGP